MARSLSVSALLAGYVSVENVGPLTTPARTDWLQIAIGEETTCISSWMSVGLGFSRNLETASSVHGIQTSSWQEAPTHVGPGPAQPQCFQIATGAESDAREFRGLTKRMRFPRDSGNKCGWPTTRRREGDISHRLGAAKPSGTTSMFQGATETPPWSRNVHLSEGENDNP